MKSNILVTVLLLITLIGFFHLYPIEKGCADDGQSCVPTATPTPAVSCTPTISQSPTITPEDTIELTDTPTPTAQITTAVAANNDRNAGDSASLDAPQAPATGHAPK